MSFEAPDRARLALAEWDVGWPVMIDEDLAIYRAYGLLRGSLVRIWLSPATVWFYARRALRGQLVRRPGADARQLGGDFIVDREGCLQFSHRSREPADRPPVDDVLDIIARLP